MEIKGIHITVKRDSKIKNINLSVLPPDGRVVVSAPEYLEDTDIKAYIISKLSWIKNCRNQIEGTTRETDRDMEGNESHYFLGQRYRLKIVGKMSGAHSVVKDGEWLVMTVQKGTSKKNRADLLWEFYREELKRILRPLVEQKAKEYGEEDVTWEVRRMRTEWGSCMVKRRHLLFNLELARVPRKCIEYIVIHELTHLQAPKHDDHFVALMNKRMPLWRDFRKELDKFPATYYDYTPDWRGEIRRMSDSSSESSVINLVMLQAILNRIALEKKPLDSEFVVSEDDELLREAFVKLNPLSNIGFEKALTLCGDTEFYYRNDGKLTIKELWIKALLEGDALGSLSKMVKEKSDTLIKEYTNMAPIIERVEAFDDDTDEVQSKISKDGKTLIRVSKNVEKYEIPTGIEVIGSGAFANCDHLTEVIFNDKLVRIESGAFIGCSFLEDIDVPKSVMKIGTDAFKNTKIEEGKLAHLYSTQGYFTPSDLSILPNNNVIVYSGDEDKTIAIESFEAKAKSKAYLNGRSISITQDDDWESITSQVEDFINYAKKHSDHRFVVVSSAYNNKETSNVVDLWLEAKNVNNIILPFALYSAIEEAENNSIQIDKIARYKFGGIINFSYIVNAINLYGNSAENERVKKLITDYNKDHAKEMLFPLCKRYNTGMSLHPNEGLYIGDGDQYYDEGSFEVKIIGVKSHQLQKIASEICSMFVQESVLVKDEIEDAVYFLRAPIIDINEHPALKTGKTI